MENSRLLLTLLIVLIITGTLPSSLKAADKNGVSPNTISLPSGPGSIEGLGGAFQPMLNTGMATYEVDMTLPAGVNSHTPTLTLRYDSGLGDGPAGIGWRFGPGSISRQIEKGIPRYVDGSNGLDDDHDGEIDEPDEADVFIGFEGEEIVPLADGTYRARIEGAFIRYRRIGDHWEAHLRDGTKLEFGLTLTGRLTDTTSARVYRWLLEKSTDTNGNVIRYIYTDFPASNNQKYLKEIRYGPGAPLWQAFYFAALIYEDRPDWRKDYRSGFLIKTTRRLAWVHIGIQGESPPMCKAGDWNNDGEPDALIRLYSLSYKDNNIHWSYLSRVTQYGSDGINYLPPISFSYALFDPNTIVSAKDVIIGGINEPSSVMDSQFVELVDLNRDGLPDLLKTDLSGGRHTGYLNLGATEEGIRWEQGKDIHSEDGLALHLYLSENRVHLADMDGDGISDLVQNDNIGQVHYFQNRGNLSWAGRKNMSIQDTSPPSPFENPQVKTSDLDFDKRIDILKSSENGYSAWFNIEKGKYSQEVRTPGALHLGQAILFSETGVHLADMNGDRMNDVVQVTPTQVIYCANMGHGYFDQSISIPIPDQVLTDGPNGHITKAQLQDINADGLSDLVIERAAANQLWYWLNLGNDTFTSKHTITDMPSSYGYNMVTRWADINGNGTTDLIYADSSAIPRLRALDIGELVGGSDHPNMLTTIDNGLGFITRIHYKSTTKYALKAQSEGNPWSMTLPFPVSVVARVETTPSLDLDGIPGKDIYVKEYLYRDGYYDDLEKTFRGFNATTLIEHGDETAPTQITKHHFFTGGPDGLDNDNDSIKDEISPEGYREDEPLKGIIREIEIRSEDDILYNVEENIWEVKTLFINPQGIEGRFAYRPEQNTRIYEGTTTPEILKTTFSYDDYGNITKEKNYGALSIAGDEVFTHTTYIYNTKQWILDKYSIQYKTYADGQKVAETRRYYDGEAFIGLEQGLLDKGNLSREEGWVEADKYVNVIRNQFDPYGNIIGIMDGNGNLREIEYDQLFHTFPLKETLYTGGDVQTLAIKVQYDLGFGKIIQSTDFNGQITHYGYDVFGRLVKIIKPADSFTYPTKHFIYTMGDSNQGIIYSYDETGNLNLYSGELAVNSITTKSREQFGELGTFDSIQYLDGLNRKLAVVEEAEQGFIVKEAALFNARETNRFNFLAYRILVSDYLYPDTNNAGIEIYYDVTGREILRINPEDKHGNVTHAITQYLPLRKILRDENNNINSYVHDGLERLIEIHEENKGDIYITRYEYDPLDNLTKIIDAQNNVKIISYDGLKRKRKIQDPDRGQLLYEYDNAGNLIQIKDNKGQVILYTYDAANRILTEDFLDDKGIIPDISYHYDTSSSDYPDADNLKGTLSWVQDLAGAEFFSFDARGNKAWRVRRICDEGLCNDYKTKWIYDAMERVDSMIYPDGDKVSWSYNSRALLESIPGLVENIDYSVSGNLGSISYVNGIETRYIYDPRQRLIRLETKNTLKDSKSIQRLSYTQDGVGNITAITDSRNLSEDPLQNATQRFEYDDLYRLTQAKGPAYGVINYQYDKIGNMIFKKSPDPPDPNHIEDTLTNLGGMHYGGILGSNNRKERLQGDPPGPHAITSTGSGLQYDYGDNGNMISNANGDTYSWDFKDRLVRVQKDGTETNYVYDYSGQRILKKVDDGSVEKNTWYIGKEYEMREEKAIKYVFAGERRVAKIEGKMICPDCRKQQILSFQRGWNFFALEVEPENPDIGVVFDLIKENLTEVWAFDPLTKEYKGYVPSEGIYDFTEIQAQKGYLINMRSQASLPVEGIKTDEDINLSAGWNLVGCASDADITIQELLSNIKEKIGSVWAFDSATKKWRFFDPSEHEFLNSLEKLEPGKAYWVDVIQDCQIVYVNNLQEKICFYHPDHLGSSNLVTDMNGEVIESIEYYPYGRVRYERKDNCEAIYTFTGKELDEKSGLMYYEARYYEPVLGRFITVDPSDPDWMSPQSLHQYGYCRNNPLKYIDPDGLYGKEVHYHLTKYLAEKIGFSKDKAEDIAKFNQAMDENFGTHPINLITGTPRHFRKRSEVEVDLRQAIKEQNLEKFAQHLHEYQDTFSHAGYSIATLGHLPETNVTKVSIFLSNLLSKIGIQIDPVPDTDVFFLRSEKLGEEDDLKDSGKKVKAYGRNQVKRNFSEEWTRQQRDRVMINMTKAWLRRYYEAGSNSP